MTDTVKVAVRMRPFVHTYEEGARCIIKMDPATQQTIITHPETGRTKTFTYDYSYDSFVPEGHPNHANQEKVWADLGTMALENAWKGYNVSLFAYGQTGSGKSHSMVGFPGSEGIVPRACEEMFKRIDAAKADEDNEDTTCRVEVSMIEIYNEKVRDLFSPNSHGSKVGLKVRDHPKSGPYVQDLTHNAVDSYIKIKKLMDAGTETTQAPIGFDDPPSIKPLNANLLRRTSAATVHAHDEEGIGIAGELLDRSSLRGPGDINNWPTHERCSAWPAMGEQMITLMSPMMKTPDYTLCRTETSGHTHDTYTTQAMIIIGVGHRPCSGRNTYRGHAGVEHRQG